MRKTIIVVILGLIFLNPLFGQNENSLEKIKGAYSSFKYNDVISLAVMYLASGETFTRDEIIDIYTMKGVSHYSLNELDDARQSFIEILKMDEEFVLNPTLISPKIILFFDNIKKDYQHMVTNAEVQKPDSTQFLINELSTENFIHGVAYQKNTFVRSIILPGLGHIYSGEQTKGWILLGVSAPLIGSIVYTIIETNSREDAYMAETNQELILLKYNDYNEMYKTRNLLIGAYAAVWLYTQIDLLFFNDQLPDNIISIQSNNTSTNFNLSISLPF